MSMMSGGGDIELVTTKQPHDILLPLNESESTKLKTDTASSTSRNNLNTRQNMQILIDEIETISKALIVQTSNSSRPKGVNEPNVDIMELTKALVEKQEELNSFTEIAREQQILNEKIKKVQDQIGSTEKNVKRLITCLKEAEQILSSAIYQANMKLDMIHKSKPLPSEEIIRYAHKISADNAVCCPENWFPGNPKRPYPTDADMRKGWLARLNTMDPIAIENEDEETQKQVSRSNSQIINPIVQTDFDVKDDEFMSDCSSDSSSDSD